MLDRSRQHLAFLVCSLSLILALGGSLLPVRANTSRVRNGRNVRAGQSRLASSLRDCDVHHHAAPLSRELAQPPESDDDASDVAERPPVLAPPSSADGEVSTPEVAFVGRQLAQTLSVRGPPFSS